VSPNTGSFWPGGGNLMNSASVLIETANFNGSSGRELFIALKLFKLLALAEFSVLLRHFAKDLCCQNAQLLPVAPVPAAERDGIGFSPMSSPIPEHRQQTVGNSLPKLGEKYP
jgi:hypothetical protein